MEVKFIDIITCRQCELRLERYRDIRLMDFIKERKNLPRCGGCRKLAKAMRKR